MDAKQLMLGDYVINTEFGKNEIGQIDILEPTRVWLKGGKTYVPINYIEPIPLTPEILEKNGFIVCENTGNKHDYIWYDNKSYIYVIFRNDGNLLVTMETDLNEGRGINSVHNCDIFFVHELQHVLRLCGIDKKIKLNN